MLSIYQFNASVVDRLLKKHDQAARKLAAELKGTTIASWIDNLSGDAPGYAYRYLVELDFVIA